MIKWLITLLITSNALLQDIFNLPIDGKLSSKGKLIAHPLIIFENKETKTYYCIRLQTANKSTIKNDILIDNKTYQSNDYWKNHQGVAVTKDVFIIDKELLESNIDNCVYEDTFELNDSDKNLIINDLAKRINSIPPNLNILKISTNNLENNLVLYTNDDLINSQLNSTIKSKDYRIKQSIKNYYTYHFNKDKFLKNVNVPNEEYTKEALRNIKLCINKELNIHNNNFEYELDKETNNYVYKEIIKSNNPNILSEFDKTPTSFEASEVIKEYKESLKENKDEDKLNQNEEKENKLKH